MTTACIERRNHRLQCDHRSACNVTAAGPAMWPLPGYPVATACRCVQLLASHSVHASHVLLHVPRGF